MSTKIALSLAVIVAAKTSFSELVSQDLFDLGQIVVEFNTTDKLLAKQAKEIASNRKAPITVVGKVLAAYQARFDALVKDGTLGTDVRFAEYFENQTRVKWVSMGRPLQCARVFTKMVDQKSLGVTELDYDNVAEDWLYLTSTIIDLLVKAGKWDIEKPSDEMLDVASILRIRGKKGAEQLRALKNKLEGKVTVDPSGKGPELDAPNAHALIQRILGGELASTAGPVNGLLTVASALAVKVKEAATLDEELARKLYFAVTGMVADFPAELVAKFVKPATPVPTAPTPAPAKAKGKAKPQQLPEKATPATPDFAGWVKGAFPDMPADSAAQMVDVVGQYYAEKNALPPSVEAFDAWSAVSA